ncbi:MAG TPA: sensor histidine kinase KdpD [Candidatus Limnocylindrales bacterium]|nr:sensor histidine kinase KdpD [Candidatus Limnocylindrales bacterium]
MTARERDELDVRPSPEELLARYRTESAGTGGRGRLRLYLGMAPGVGKTYRMLEEGHRRAGRGTDVVVGYVEDHGRALTAALVTGLEVVPRRSVVYRGMTVDEMDPDAVIARRPTVALVDELAHTNVPGSVRPKRWEDVEAIRDAGVHVVSTMNVQHLDSIADAVATITGAPVHERLPDDVLLGADEIELVDMSPHALRQRMRHGNVYPPDRTRIALDRFFTEANLTALRELALRVTARRVEGQLEDVNHASLGLVAERVLVLVDGSPSSARAVRRAASMAGAIHGALIALVPAQAVIDALPFDRARDLREALDDAVELGAAALRFDVTDPVELVALAVESTGAHQLFLPWSPPGRLGGIGRRPVADRIAERLPDLDLHLVAPKP